MTNVEHVVEMIRSEQSVDVYAAAHALDAEHLRETRDAFLAGASAARQPTSRRGTLAVLGGLVAVALLLPTGVLAAGGCSPTVNLPGLLKPFCPNTPATAADMNFNLNELARFIEGRTGPMTGSLNNTTQVSGAKLTVSDNSFDLEATSVELNSGANGGTALRLVGDTLHLGDSNFTGGVRLNQHTTATGNLQVDGNITSSNNFAINGNATVNGTSNFNGVASFISKPYFNAGFTRRNCRDVYGAFGGTNGYSLAVCNEGEYMNGLKCRDNGFNSLECMAFCCSP